MHVFECTCILYSYRRNCHFFVCQELLYNYLKWVCLTCNITYVKVTKNSKFLLKINNYLLKSYVFNTKYTSSNAKLLFKTS